MWPAFLRLFGLKKSGWPHVPAGPDNRFEPFDLTSKRGPQPYRHPPGLRFPHQGQRFRLRSSLGVAVGIWFNAPWSSGCTATLQAGEILLLNYEPDPGQTTGVSLIPERYDELEASLVPDKLRHAGPYSGYTVGISYVDLNRCFDW